MLKYFNRLLLLVALIGCNVTQSQEQPTQPPKFALEELLENEETKTLADLEARLAPYNGDSLLITTIAWRLVEESKNTGISPYLLLSLIVTESDVDPKAISRAGALGLGQVMPRYWKDVYPSCGADLFDIQTNLCYSARILKHYLVLAQGDVSKALQLYSGGENLYEFTVQTRCARFSDEGNLESLDTTSECVFHSL